MFHGGKPPRTRGGASATVVSCQRRLRLPLAVIFAFAFWATLSSATITSQGPPLPCETLLIDTRDPVLLPDGEWAMLSHEDHMRLLRRQDDGGDYDNPIPSTAADAPPGPTAEADSGDGYSTSMMPTPESTTSATPTSSSASSSSTSTRRGAPTVSNSPLPSPIDGALLSNWTGDQQSSNCPTFLKSMLNDQKFKACYPLSMLLQGSSSFFEAQKSIVSMTQVLDASCAANVTQCQDYLSGVSRDLVDDKNCGSEFAMSYSTVTQAYLGLVAYQSLYSAGCLRDASTSAYCFANAVTNLTNPRGVYVYYLPLNLTFPDSSKFTCNDCTKKTLEIFQSTAANRKLSIAYTYEDAANTAKLQCGANFANSTLPAPLANSAPFAMGQAQSTLLLPLLVMLISTWLL